MRLRDISILLLCTILLVVRLGGAHLHLCFDGQETFASVHLADAGDRFEHTDAEPTHNDSNIDLSSVGLSKLSKLDVSLLALIFSIAAWQFGDPRSRWIQVRTVLVSIGSLPHVVPPPRGPPLTSVS